MVEAGTGRGGLKEEFLIPSKFSTFCRWDEGYRYKLHWYGPGRGRDKRGSEE